MPHLQLKVVLTDDSGKIRYQRTIGGPLSRMTALCALVDEILTKAVGKKKNVQRTDD